MHFLPMKASCLRGAGFSLFGTAHLCWMGGIVLAVIVLTALFLQQPEYRQRTYSRRLAVLLCLLIAVEKKRCWPLTGHLTVYSLPLHLCELAPFCTPAVFVAELELAGPGTLYPVPPRGGGGPGVSGLDSLSPSGAWMNINSFLVHGLLILFRCSSWRRNHPAPAVRHLEAPVSGGW